MVGETHVTEVNVSHWEPSGAKNSACLYEQEPAGARGAQGAAQKPDGKGGAPQDDSGMSEKETDLKDMVDHSKVCVWMRPHLRAC